MKTKGTLMLVVLVAGIVMGCVGQEPSQQTTPVQVSTPAIQQNALATVIGKTFVIKNIRVSTGAFPQNKNIEYSFGATLIITSLDGKQSSDSVKISEFRLSDGLYVNLTDFGEAVKQTNYPYWQKMTFYDNGYYTMKDYDGDFITGEWSIK